MEPCRDFTFRFWVHEHQGQLDRDVTAETRSHMVSTPTANRPCELRNFMWNPTHLAVRPPRRLRKEWIGFIKVRETFWWQQEKLLMLTLLQPPSG